MQSRVHRNSRQRSGFTLIELIAVIVILAILAGVAIPRYFDHASSARESSAKGVLGGVRSGITNFYANEAVAGEARYPTLEELTEIGTVMQEPIPENPYKDSDDQAGIREATWDEDDPPVTNDPEGWNYDPDAGRFWANSETVSEDDGGPENTW